MKMLLAMKNPFLIKIQIIYLSLCSLQAMEVLYKNFWFLDLNFFLIKNRLKIKNRRK